MTFIERILLRINKLIKKLSPTIELITIIIIGFGLFIYSSTRSFLVVTSSYSHSWTLKLTNQSHLSILIYEVIALLIIFYILKVREWKISDFNLTFTFRLIWIALLLMFIRNIIGNVVFKILEAFDVIDDTVVKHVQFGLEANWFSISLIIIINSVFEELILIGYLFKRLEKYNPVIIIGLSIFIRQLYHTYQGWLSIVNVLSIGLVFGYYYYRHKKLWPIIIAHGFGNLITFSAMHFQWHEKMQNLR